jgi:hypothetical protein
MGRSIFHRICEAPLGRAEAIDFGAGGRRVALLAHRIRSAVQRSNNEQQIAASNKTSTRI